MSTRAAFLFASGFCALIYQTMWLRELRSVFGASTPANAAVLAVFMGGLGAGSWFFGKRAERSTRPLTMYAHLELGIAASAALSPLLVDVARAAYLAVGGSSVLGGIGATVARLLLSALALGVPAFLMGGTFPAMTRSLLGATSETEERRPLALLYGSNTIGAVVGVALSTFVLLDVFGVRRSLWIACLLNALVAMTARSLGRNADATIAPAPPSSSASAPLKAPIARGLVLAFSFATGFAFLLLELVWYRMSAPILGGSTYSFGLVLAIALLGVGAGGFLYAFFGPTHATRGGFAITCALEALLLLVPFYFGDDVARLAFALHELGRPSFPSLVAGWIAITGVLVFPAALVAGWQFPSLLALAGAHKEGAAEDSGFVYAANTAGSIVGSIAGGFGALPLLGALGAWRFAAAVLVVAGALAALSALRAQEWRRALAACAFGAVAIALACAPGPTALWRHTGIGAGRADLYEATWNAREEHTRAAGRFLEEHDGVESSLAFKQSYGASLLTNGKSDGATIGDQQTQIGLTLMPALLFGAPKNAFVIGLGTGESAGWLGKVDGVERVDVAEIEPRVVDFVRAAAVTNLHALDNPKVHLVVGDGREALATSKIKYDLIVAEPSNPYRAGVASFYTADFYREAQAKLVDGGVLAQWLQAYEIDPEALQQAIATAAAVFPDVSAYELEPTDLLLVCRSNHAPVDVAGLRARIDQPTFDIFTHRIFRQSSAEGILSRAIANDSFLRKFAGDAFVNTDDLPALELSFAKSVGKHQADFTSALRAAAKQQGQMLPALSIPVDDALVDAQRGRAFVAAARTEPPPGALADPVESAWAAGDFARADVLRARDDALAPSDDTSRLVRVHLRAASHGNAGDPALAADVDALAEHGLRTEAAFIRLDAAITDGIANESASDALPGLLKTALDTATVDPWIPDRLLISPFTRLSSAKMSPELAEKLAAILVEPNAIGVPLRLGMAHDLLASHPAKKVPRLCVALYSAYEPNPRWTKSFLEWRADCYQSYVPERAAAAVHDLAAFVAHEPASIDVLLPKDQPRPMP